MYTIPLTKGVSSVVDDEDADLGRLNWYAVLQSNGGLYGARKSPRPEGHKTIWLAHVVAERMGLRRYKWHRVDHINGDSLDNRRANLRLVSARENAWNTNRRLPGNKSGHTGVTWDRSRRRWLAHIKINGRLKNLGRFADKEQAIAARARAEIEARGVQPQRQGYLTEALPD